MSCVQALNFQSFITQGLLKVSAVRQHCSSTSKLLILSMFRSLSNNIVANVPYHPPHKNTVPNFMSILPSSFLSSLINQVLLLICPLLRQSLLNPVSLCKCLSAVTMYEPDNFSNNLNTLWMSLSTQALLKSATSEFEVCSSSILSNI